MTKRARTTGRGKISAATTSGGRFAVRPGTFNLAGELFTPEGNRLSRLEEDIREEVAAVLVRDGAEVAFEACGCGGGGQCKPYWPGKAKIKALSRSSLPQMSPRPTAPTWIDVWAGDGTTVVFCHGDITWGSLLP
ncbi:hypothetical protein [Curtobacterium oceanosedimentum]|uniref:hypothetical protein n=1 Tax=Curtobacterium oceanosedimentum TaxID=465820 RepID=UPI00128ECBCA|nr:hypothetical protein [Curtobacterium oceanosedimentum]